MDWGNVSDFEPLAIPSHDLCYALDKEQWEPILDKVWSSAGSEFSIREAWALEWQSHGDSAILNEEVLGAADSKFVCTPIDAPPIPR